MSPLPPQATIYGAKVRLPSGQEVIARFIYKVDDPFAFWVQVPTATFSRRHIVRVGSRDMLIYAFHVPGEWVPEHGNAKFKFQDGAVAFDYRYHTQGRGTPTAQIIEGTSFVTSDQVVLEFLAQSQALVPLGAEADFLSWPGEVDTPA